MVLVFGALWNIECKVLQIFSENGIEALVLKEDNKKTKWIERLTGIKVIVFNRNEYSGIPTKIDTLLLIIGGSDYYRNIIYDLISIAKKGHFKRIICVSAYNFILGPNSYVPPANSEIETLVNNSGINNTIIEASTPMESFLFQAKIISEKSYFIGNSGKIRFSFIDSFDIARVIAKIITEHNSQNRIIRLTGPDSIDFRRVAEILGKVINRKIRYINLPSFVLKYLLSKNIEVPSWYIKVWLENTSQLKRSSVEAIMKTTEEIPGFKLTSVSEFAGNYSYLFIGKKYRNR